MADEAAAVRHARGMGDVTGDVGAVGFCSVVGRLSTCRRRGAARCAGERLWFGAAQLYPSARRSGCGASTTSATPTLPSHGRRSARSKRAVTSPARRRPSDPLGVVMFESPCAGVPRPTASSAAWASTVSSLSTISRTARIRYRVTGGRLTRSSGAAARETGERTATTGPIETQEGSTTTGGGGGEQTARRPALSILMIVEGALPNMRPAEQRAGRSWCCPLCRGVGELDDRGGRRCQTSETTVLRSAGRSDWRAIRSPDRVDRAALSEEPAGPAARRRADRPRRRLADAVGEDDPRRRVRRRPRLPRSISPCWKRPSCPSPEPAVWHLRDRGGWSGRSSCTRSCTGSARSRPLVRSHLALTCHLLEMATWPWASPTPSRPWTQSTP